MKFDSPYDAEQVLKEAGFKKYSDILAPPREDHELTEDEMKAINYLCREWDYSYMEDYDES
jgi:hypothetical protein